MINFPTSPALNDIYTYLGRTWVWNGSGWEPPDQRRPGVSVFIQPGVEVQLDILPLPYTITTSWYQLTTSEAATHGRNPHLGIVGRRHEDGHHRRHPHLTWSRSSTARAATRPSRGKWRAATRPAARRATSCSSAGRQRGPDPAGGVDERAGRQQRGHPRRRAIVTRCTAPGSRAATSTPSNLTASSGTIMGDDSNCVKVSAALAVATIYATGIVPFYFDSAEAVIFCWQNPSNTTCYACGAGSLLVDASDNAYGATFGKAFSFAASNMTWANTSLGQLDHGMLPHQLRVRGSNLLSSLEPYWRLGVFGGWLHRHPDRHGGEQSVVRARAAAQTKPRVRVRTQSAPDGHRAGHSLAR